MTMTRLLPAIFPPKLCMLSVGLQIVGFNITVQYGNIQAITSTTNYVYAISVFLRYFSYSFFIFGTFHWLLINVVIRYNLFSKFRPIRACGGDVEQEQQQEQESPNPHAKLKNDIFTTDNFFIIFMISIFVTTIIIILTIKTPLIRDFTPLDLATNNIAFSFMAFGFLMYHLRKFRSDASLRLVRFVTPYLSPLRAIHIYY